MNLGDRGSEYDPPRWLQREVTDAEEFEKVRIAFRVAGGPYLSSPWPWVAWAFLLPLAALGTRVVEASFGPVGVLLLWSFVILAGGAVEATWMSRARAGGSALAAWALRVQGNLSLIAVSLSVLLLVLDATWALPGLWLLLLGHSFFSLGGLSFAALRRYGLAYQLGGLAAFAAAYFGTDLPLTVFALSTFLANAGLAWAVWRRREMEFRKADVE